MESLRKYIGTPSAIIAFETAGRHLNFTRAAEELNVSQPAISRQIRNLEHHIGKPLFVRRGNKVQFTRHGLILFEATNGSFRHIIAAIDRINSEASDNTLVLRSLPIFLSTFVLPLLADLQRTFPGFSIDIQSLENSAAIDHERPTISILYGDGSWPGMNSELLFNDVYFPVCHPLALKGIKTSDPKEIFEHLPLLQLSTFIDPWMDWHQWIRHIGIDNLTIKRPQIFNDYEMLLRACRSGHGVAIGALYLVDAALLEGSLVRVTDITMNSNFGFHFVYHPTLVKQRDLGEVLSWLRDRSKETQQRCLSVLEGASINGVPAVKPDH